MIYILISFFVMAVYVGVMIRKEGIPASISATFYSLMHPKVFTSTMIVSAVTFVAGCFQTGCNATVTSLFTGMGLCLVGISPNFRTTEKKMHIAGAVITVVSSLVFVAFNCAWLLLAWIPFLLYELFWGIPKKWTGDLKTALDQAKVLFVAEIICLLTTYIAAL